jgi:hypothetical protein
VAAGKRWSPSKNLFSAVSMTPKVEIGRLCADSHYAVRIQGIGEWGELIDHPADATFKTKAAPKSLPLSDIPGLRAGPAGSIFDRDREFLLAPLQAGKRKFKKGVTFLGADELAVELPDKYSNLTGYFAVPRKGLGDLDFPSLKLQIWSDEPKSHILFESDSIKPESLPLRLDVKWRGRVDRLTFRVIRTDNFDRMAHWSLLNVRFRKA